MGIVKYRSKGHIFHLSYMILYIYQGITKAPISRSMNVKLKG